MIMQDNDIIVETRLHGAFFNVDLDRQLVHGLAQGMCQVINQYGSDAGKTRIFLVDDGQIAILNKRFLNCNGPTNVLSFPAKGGDEAVLFISMDSLRRESLLYGQNAREYFIRLLAHGLCHLAGLDHGPEMDDLQARLEACAFTCLAHMQP